MISESYRDDADGVVSRLRRVGVEELNVLRSVGIITGRVNASHCDEAARVEGVASVEISRPMRALERPDES